MNAMMKLQKHWGLIKNISRHIYQSFELQDGIINYVMLMTRVKGIKG